MRGEMYIVISCWSGDFYEPVKAWLFSVWNTGCFLSAVIGEDQSGSSQGEVKHGSPVKEE